MAIPAWARVGAKVVCVDDTPGAMTGVDVPFAVRDILTISGVRYFKAYGRWGIRVNVQDPCEVPRYFEIPRFRPLVEQTNDGEVERDMEAHFNKFLRVGQKEVA